MRIAGCPEGDETEEAILNRLDTYNQKTAPLVAFYERTRDC